MADVRVTDAGVTTTSFPSPNVPSPPLRNSRTVLVETVLESTSSLNVTTTDAGAAVRDARYVYNWAQDNSPLRRNPALEEVGNAGLYLLSDLSAGVTGEIHYVDSGFNVVGMCAPPR